VSIKAVFKSPENTQKWITKNNYDKIILNIMVIFMRVFTIKTMILLKFKKKSDFNDNYATNK
jgi:hypothetical protein